MQRQLKMINTGLKVKMLAIPRARHRIMHSTPVLDTWLDPSLHTRCWCLVGGIHSLSQETAGSNLEVSFNSPLRLDLGLS